MIFPPFILETASCYITLLYSSSIRVTWVMEKNKGSSVLEERLLLQRRTRGTGSEEVPVRSSIPAPDLETQSMNLGAMEIFL